MFKRDNQRMNKIRDILKNEPHGMSISQITEITGINRTTLAKDLYFLNRIGKVEMQSLGNCKVYYSASTIPISSIIDNITDLILILDENLKIIYANNSLLSIINTKKDEVIGKRIEEFNNPLFTRLKKINFMPDGIQKFEISISDFPNIGITRHFLIKNIPITFEDLSRGTTLVLKDITDFLHYRDLLRLIKKEYSGLIQLHNELIFRFLPNGDIIFANNIFNDTFAGGDISFKRKNFFSLFVDDEYRKIYEQLDNLTPHNPSTTLTSKINTNLGLRDYIFTIFTFFDSRDKIVAYQGIGKDITADLEYQNELMIQTNIFDFFCQKTQKSLNDLSYPEIFENLTAGIAEIVPNVPIIAFSYDKNMELMTLRIIRDERGKDLTEMLFGEEGFQFSFQHITSNRESDFYPFNTENFQPLSYEEYNELFGNYAATRFRNALGERLMYLKLLAWDDRPVGAIAICIKGGEDFPNRVLVETYIKIVEIALQRQITSDILSQVHERFNFITEISPIPTSIASKDGKYIFINDAFTRTFGYSLDNIPDENQWLTFSYKNFEESKNDFNLVLENSKDGNIQPRTVIVRCIDNSLKQVIIYPFALRDGCLLTIYEDTSEMEIPFKPDEFLAKQSN